MIYDYEFDELTVTDDCGSFLFVLTNGTATVNVTQLASYEYEAVGSTFAKIYYGPEYDFDHFSGEDEFGSKFEFSPDDERFQNVLNSLVRQYKNHLEEELYEVQ